MRKLIRLFGNKYIRYVQNLLYGIPINNINRNTNNILIVFIIYNSNYINFIQYNKYIQYIMNKYFQVPIEYVKFCGTIRLTFVLKHVRNA